MPTYEYECQECGHLFEELQSIKADPLVDCPKCGKPRLMRLISNGGGFLLQGTGWPSKEGRVESSSEFRKQKEVYDKSYGGADVSSAQQRIAHAGKKRRAVRNK